MTMSEGSARRAAIYLRISLDREMDGLAIERQREDCQRLAEREGWTIVETYIDQSKSATDATKSRPDYDRMVADYEAGAFDAIVCWDLDRLTRQPRQMEDWVDAARFRGLLLKSVSGDVDLTNENGLLIAGIKIQVARAFAETALPLFETGRLRPRAAVRPAGRSAPTSRRPTPNRASTRCSGQAAALGGGAAVRSNSTARARSPPDTSLTGKKCRARYRSTGRLAQATNGLLSVISHSRS